jgi:hypothetical protein
MLSCHRSHFLAVNLLVVNLLAVNLLATQRGGSYRHDPLREAIPPQRGPIEVHMALELVHLRNYNHAGVPKQGFQMVLFEITHTNGSGGWDKTVVSVCIDQNQFSVLGN